MLEILACALCDRLRGGWSIAPRWLHKLGGVTYGLLLGHLLELPTHLIPVFAALWWIGEKPGWGYPMGQALLGERHKVDYPLAKPEWWQAGYLKNDPWDSLFIRGAMWALPCTLLAMYKHTVLYMLIVAPMAMVFGLFLEKHLTPNMKASGEAWRGGLMGLGAWAV